MQYGDLRICARDLVRESARTVGGSVIHNEQIGDGQVLVNGGDDRRQIVALVVSRNDHQHAIHGPRAYSKLLRRVNMLSSLPAMQILKARVRGRDDFLEAYHADRPAGALFVATTTPLESKEEVIVELVCDGLPTKVLIPGTVMAWRPPLPRPRVRAW